ncbi:hypothetical protein AGR7A_pTi0078 [Agrobacterium deltaense NCPPB 1641]|uniref:Uncharacterized protein n=1 Tax=Agrobacterium deltaense NCPPB 1641 TaxID=1183425 RepID=A0A1S7UCQ7_9HYPH|nr:hypothetical protein AGR7A_pTi0078 [Agrobacterium deltaense NCPPB 1641]
MAEGVIIRAIVKFAYYAGKMTGVFACRGRGQS